MTTPATPEPVVHWVGDAPTSLHGNGSASFEHTTRDRLQVTCTLCLSLLRKRQEYVPDESDRHFARNMERNLLGFGR